MLQPGLGSRESRFTVRFVGFPGPSVAPLCAHRELVRAVHTEDFEQVTGIWNDGRIGTMHGNRTGNYEYHALMHFADKSEHVNVATEKKGFFTLLGEEILKFAQTKQPPVTAEETIEIIRFIEAANESRENGGKEVML